MTWKNITLNGVVYDPSHLEPFTMQVTPKSEGAPTYNERVTFTSHAFTRKWCAGDDPAGKVVEGGEQRSFCPIRYGHSLHLEQLIRQASTGRVRFNNQTPFIIPATIPGLAGPYAICFNAFRAQATGLDVVMDVRSAHHKPGLLTTLPKITFATIVGNIVAGRPIKPPRR